MTIGGKTLHSKDGNGNNFSDFLLIRNVRSVSIIVMVTENKLG